MRHRLLAVVLVAWTGLAGAQTRPAAQVSPAARQLSEELVHDAALTYLPDEPVPYLKRATVLCHLAVQLDPENAAAYRQMAEAYAGLTDFEQTDAAWAAYLKAVGYRDYGAFVDWLVHRKPVLSNVETYGKFLASMSESEALSDAERGVATLELASLEMTRGQKASVMELYRKALSFDPNLPSAIKVLVASRQDVTPAEMVKHLLAVLAGDPRDIEIVRDLARLCLNEGLHDETIALQTYAEKVALASGVAMQLAWRLEDAEALLDSGQFAEVVRRYSPLLADSSGQTQPAGLLVEAYRGLGDRDKAREMVDQMRQVYQKYESGRVKSEMAARLVWFNLFYRERPETARTWSALILEGARSDPTIQRIWAMAAIESNDPKDSELAAGILKLLAPQDGFAAGILAKKAYAAGNDAQAEGYITGAASAPRTGSGWRYLRAIAAKHGVAIAPSKHAAEVAELIKSFDPAYFEVGLNPAKAVTFSIAAQAESFAPGEPIRVEIKVTSASKVPLTVGNGGLFAPRVQLTINLAGQPNRQTVIGVVLASPRYLQPGETIRTSARVDMGKIDDTLFENPLAEFELTVTGILDPVVRGGKTQCGLPGLPDASAKLSRSALIAVDDADAYWNELVRLVRQFQGADPVKAMRAAKVTVSLLAMTQALEDRKITVGRPIARDPKRAHLLSMLRYCLQEGSTNVQCQTLGAMRKLKLNPRLVALRAPCMDSDSPLVRARAVELLGMNGDRRHVAVIAGVAARDRARPVRNMASAVLDLLKARISR